MAGGGDNPDPPDTARKFPVINVPLNITEGRAVTVYARSRADMVDSMAGTKFKALSSPLRRRSLGIGQGEVAFFSDSDPHVSSITRNAGDGSTTAVFVSDDGSQVTVRFSKEQVMSGLSNTAVSVGEVDYQLEEEVVITRWDGPRRERDYYKLGFWSQSSGNAYHDGYLVYGARTHPDNIPSTTTASYRGYFSGRFFADDGKKARDVTHRYRLWGYLGLEANFETLSISGTVDNLLLKSPRDNGDRWIKLLPTTMIDISGGRIGPGRFSATWTGRDTDPDNPMEKSVRGFSGPVIGDFYGPNADEVAGVFNGKRDNEGTDELISGVFEGGKYPE